VAKPNPRRKDRLRRDAIRRRLEHTQQPRCPICGLALDYGLPARTPFSVEVDELVPVSLGGDPFDQDNCRLVHRICNEKRGNRPASFRLDPRELRARRGAAAELPHSQEW